MRRFINVVENRVSVYIELHDNYNLLLFFDQNYFVPCHILCKQLSAQCRTILTRSILKINNKEG